MFIWVGGGAFPWHLTSPGRMGCDWLNLERVALAVEEKKIPSSWNWFSRSNFKIDIVSEPGFNNDPDSKGCMLCRSHLHAFGVYPRDGTTANFCLAGTSETDSQKWMATLRKLLRPPLLPGSSALSWGFPARELNDNHSRDCHFHFCGPPNVIVCGFSRELSHHGENRRFSRKTRGANNRFLFVQFTVFYFCGGARCPGTARQFQNFVLPQSKRMNLPCPS